MRQMQGFPIHAGTGGHYEVPIMNEDYSGSSYPSSCSKRLRKDEGYQLMVPGPQLMVSQSVPMHMDGQGHLHGQVKMQAPFIASVSEECASVENLDPENQSETFTKMEPASKKLNMMDHGNTQSPSEPDLKRILELTRSMQKQNKARSMQEEAKVATEK